MKRSRQFLEKARGPCIHAPPFTVFEPGGLPSFVHPCCDETRACTRRVAIEVETIGVDVLSRNPKDAKFCLLAKEIAECLRLNLPSQKVLPIRIGWHK